MNITELKNLLTSITGSEPRPAGEGFICQCPAHDDKTASLSINEGRDGLLLKCHAGCSFESVTVALGVKPAELFFKNGVSKHGKAANSDKFNIVATYPYYDAGGKLVFEVCRLDPKGFCQRRPDPTAPGKWLWNLKGVKHVPYRLRELLTAVKTGESIFIVEGEKDVAALVAKGFPATCNAAGAGKWQNDFAEYFDSAKAVCIIADKDAPGRKHAVAVAANVKGRSASIKVIELPDVAGRSVKDAHDFFEAGGTADKLLKIVEAAKEFEPIAEAIITDTAERPAERVTNAGMICVADEAKISAVPHYIITLTNQLGMLQIIEADFLRLQPPPPSHSLPITDLARRSRIRRVIPQRNALCSGRCKIIPSLTRASWRDAQQGVTILMDAISW